MTLQRKRPISLMGSGSWVPVPVWSTPVIVSFLLISLGSAQVTIKNPQHLDVPEQRVQMLHRIICRVVAEEFHIAEREAEGPVTLLLGEEHERTVVDERNGHIYLHRWDEAAFAISDTELAVQRMLSRHRFERIAREVIRRANKIAPVNANAARGELRSADSNSIGVVVPEPERNNKEPP